MERLRREIEMVRAQFGEVTVPPDVGWLIIERFPLPEGMYNRGDTRLLHMVGKAYPQTPPDNFLVPAGLRTSDGGMPGTGYKEGQSNFGETWGVFSWHAESWNPRPEILDGDNLVTFLFSVQQRLEGR